MKISNKIKILVFLLVVFLSIWMGGTIIRSNMAYEIFETGTNLQIKQYYSNEILLHTVRLFAFSAAYTGIAYLLSVIISIILIISFRKYLKQNGWLFMAFLLFFLSAPIELYVCYLDYELNMTLLFGGVKDFWDGNLQKYFLMRFSKLSQLSPITVLSVITSLFMIIWKPLRLENNEEQRNI